MSVNLCGCVRNNVKTNFSWIFFFPPLFFNPILVSELFWKNINWSMLLQNPKSMEQCHLKNCISERILVVCRREKKKPHSGQLADPSYITQTPSGTLDNTALTLIQVLNLHRGLAVINLDYSYPPQPVPLTIKLPSKILNDQKQLILPSQFVILCGFLLFSHLLLCDLWTSSSSGLLSLRLFSPWTASGAMATHWADLLTQTFQTSAQNCRQAFENVLGETTLPLRYQVSV